VVWVDILEEMSLNAMVAALRVVMARNDEADVGDV
jgi:hypothetical protein